MAELQCSSAPVLAGWRLPQLTHDGNSLTFSTESQVRVRPKVSRPISLGVKQHLGPKSRFLLMSVVGLFMWGALSDERTGLSFLD
jgi:hypothetical protein